MDMKVNLRSEEEIMAAWDRKYDSKPIVTVLCITYNHEAYIAQCIESFLMQETSFPFTILVHDDASTDSTAQIIRSYAKRYPSIIKPVIEEENLWSQGRVAFEQMKAVYLKTKYIAFCEGDDYWSDSSKLQMQFDFLEKNNQYSAVGHLTKIIDKNGNPVTSFIDSKPGEYTVADNNKWQLYVHASSYFFRNVYMMMSEEELVNYANTNVPGDRKYPLLFLKYGKCYVLDKEMSVYRYMSCESSYTSQRHTRADTYREYEEAEVYAHSIGIDVDYSVIKREMLHKTFQFLIRYGDKSFSEILKIRNNKMHDVCDCILFYLKEIPKFIKKRCVNK